MSSAFGTALSALTADSTAIDVVGNNLANLNTTGFKASEIGFSDVMSQSLGVGTDNSQIGMGVNQISTSQNFTQGSLTTTSGPLDAALQGNGFFVVKDSAGNQLYTRDGSFQLDANGNLLTASGQNVEGWSAVNGVVNANGAVSNISLPVGSVMPPATTANMSMNVNLDSQTAANGTFSAPIQVYDTLGTAHTLTVNYTETGPGAWTYTVTIPNSDEANPVAGTTSTTLATGQLGFDASGNLTTPVPAVPPALNAPVPVTTGAAALADGANLSINWNLFNSAGTPTITQYAGASAMSNPTQDGYAAGQISSFGIQTGGLIVASYTNGQQVTMGQLAVASIANPTSMLQVGNNNLQASAATAQAAIGAAGSGGRAAIVGGALESSNTDMAAQFTQLLTYERSYQAASRVITTSDQLAQDTVALVQA
jgi:flagellar hook protein FlgE